VPITDHKFASLHAAVWSGGTFIYVPKGVKVNIPLQAYFRMNAKSGGQFEHTLIIADEGSEVFYIEGCSAPQYDKNSLHAGCVEIFVKKNARVRYSSVENWSKNTYNLNTKRAVVEENGSIEWIGGNMGSGVTMLYPCSVLKGKNSSAEHIGIAFGGKGQHQDTGAKVIMLAPDTSCLIKAKSISKDGGIANYRGLLTIAKGATNAKAHVMCDALILDERSKSDTTPYMRIQERNVDVGHEATVGKISDEKLFYLMSRGLSEDEALKLVVSGFIEPIVKELPVEYAVELNRLIELEMEGVG
jgi:Fe-S cluster assembly protein SufB